MLITLSLQVYIQNESELFHKCVSCKRVGGIHTLVYFSLPGGQLWYCNKYCTVFIFHIQYKTNFFLMLCAWADVASGEKTLSRKDFSTTVDSMATNQPMGASLI